MKPPPPPPLNLREADKAGSDVFFEALLQSCATPTQTRSRSRRDSAEYESTPELDGHREPRSLHRKSSRTSKPSESQREGVLEALETRRLNAQGPENWPKRSSSSRGSDTYHRSSSLRMSFESLDLEVEVEVEVGMEDGNDHYSDARHDVLRNGGFWPRSPRSERKVSPRRSVVFEPAPQPTITISPASHSASRSVGENGRPTHPPPAAPPPHLELDTPAPKPSVEREVEEEDSAYESDPSLNISYENTPIFTPRCHWPHTFPSRNPSSTRPPFKHTTLETHRLADPGLWQNATKPLPSVPYRHLSWQPLSREEFLISLGHHALKPDLGAGRPGRDPEGFPAELMTG